MLVGIIICSDETFSSKLRKVSRSCKKCFGLEGILRDDGLERETLYLCCFGRCSLGLDEQVRRGCGVG